MFIFYCFLPIVFIFLSIMLLAKTVKLGLNKKIAFLLQFSSSLVVSILCSFLISNDHKVKAESEVNSKSSVVSSNSDSKNFAYGMGLLAAAIAFGIGAIGGGMAIASGLPAAIAALTEDPNISGKVLIFLAFGEAISIYGLVIAIMILGRLDILI